MVAMTLLYVVFIVALVVTSVLHRLAVRRYERAVARYERAVGRSERTVEAD